MSLCLYVPYVIERRRNVVKKKKIDEKKKIERKKV